ncbi:MAG: ferric reductase-like transmembrane domain-containing protein [Gammaproteobacteria bacterium]|nr:ferric reductase-like transmembrane domain-containing protein [Gammaproteobacteria bacterium]
MSATSVNTRWRRLKVYSHFCAKPFTGFRYPLQMLRRLLDSPYSLWMLLTLPGAITVINYINGETFYGEVVHFTGELSARLLIVTMAITPLRLMFPGRRWIGWLMQRRRYFGVATFGYAALHTGVYAARLKLPAEMLAEAAEPGILTGWLALAIFIPLAITSNEWSVRRFGRWWKRIHRWVYAAALLTFAHWLLVAFDVVPGLIHLLVLGVLESYRIWKMRSTN